MRSGPSTPSVLLGLLLTAFVGCGEATVEVGADAHDHDHGHDHDHDHGGRPASLHAAVAQVTTMRDTIREAILNGDPDDAHDPLHEVGGLLEAIPDVAAETDLPKAEWDAVNAANEKLFDAFGAVDKAFHTKDADKKAAYEGVAEELDAALEAIRSRLALTGEEPDKHDHDHDHHDHDHGDHDHDHDHDHDDEGHDHEDESAEAAAGDAS